MPPSRPGLPPAPAADVVLAAVLFGIGQSQVWLGWHDGSVGTIPHGHEVARALLVAVFTLPLAWRRSRPVVAELVICAGLIVQVVAVAPEAPFLVGLLPMAMANYSTAAYGPGRLRGMGLAAIGAVLAVIYSQIPAERTGGEVLFGVFVALGTWVVGDVVRARMASAERGLEAARALVVEQEVAAEAALADERVRIARELHDVIAHSVAVMGVQAGAARTLIDVDPAEARQALRGIEATARSSVAELARLLTVLRHDNGAPARLPQPGLGQLPALVEQLRAAGLEVSVSVDGVAEELPPGVDLSAYRVVQEALTNALKHGTGSATLAVSTDGGSLRIEVRNPVALPRPSPATVGHGLVGMRERALLYGGNLEAGLDDAGGFVVRAHLRFDAEKLSWSRS